MKVYVKDDNEPCALGNNRQHTIPFHYEKHRFTETSNITEADIIPAVYTTNPDGIAEHINFFKSNNVSKNQLIVLLDIFHVGDGERSEDYHLPEYYEAGYNLVYVTTCYNRERAPHKLFYDHYFNRQKAYFVDYEKYDMKHRIWSFKATKKMYELNEVVNKNLSKKFLVPNKLYGKNFFTEIGMASEDTSIRTKYRRYLHSALLEQDCYFSSPDTWIFLDSQEMSDDIINDIHYYHGGMGFHPLANRYYETSAVSAYTESVVQTERGFKSMTEKSFNPLIKGHFILPFSYANYVHDLVSMYGFKLPNWINYSYDSIEDDNLRFFEFMKEFTKIRFKSLQELETLCNNNIDILKHNRNVFFERAYDSLYDKLENSINTIIRS